MQIELNEATLRDKPIIQNMMQLYLYDFSEIEGFDPDERGLFHYRYLDQYWTEEDRFPFTVRMDGRLAGFVLVNQHSYTSEAEFVIGEFFIMRKYRRKGLGTQVARKVFDKFAGTWEVREVEKNVAAQDFWRKVIRDYTGGAFKEYSQVKGWNGPVQVFTSKTLSPS